VSQLASERGSDLGDQPNIEEAEDGLPEPDRNRHTARWVAVTILVVAAGLIAVLATRPPAAVDEVQNPVVGKMAPPLSGPTLTGGSFSLARHPGKFVVVSFFASWCEQCQAEGPELVKFQFEHQRSADATVLSVVFSDSLADARASQAQLGVTWPTLTDSGGTIALGYGVRQLPSTFLIAPDGNVVAAVVAPVTADDLDQLIAKAKAEHA
jgi:cytochrome c biogenesis protein CcmG, thiol:disulfide interchange protein DsbE